MFSFIAATVIPSVLHIAKELLMTAAFALTAYVVNKVWSMVHA